MKTKSWKPIDFEDCPECGHDIEVFTDCEDGFFYDGDAVRCPFCGFESSMSVDESGESWVSDNYDPEIEDKKLCKDGKPCTRPGKDCSCCDLND